MHLNLRLVISMRLFVIPHVISLRLLPKKKKSPGEKNLKNQLSSKVISVMICLNRMGCLRSNLHSNMIGLGLIIFLLGSLSPCGMSLTIILDYVEL